MHRVEDIFNIVLSIVIRQNLYQICVSMRERKRERDSLDLEELSTNIEILLIEVT